MNSSHPPVDSPTRGSDLGIIHVTETWAGASAPAGLFAQLQLHQSAESLSIAISASYTHMPPPPSPAGHCWKLWEHEVVELFITGPDDRYIELEFGPHGHHLALALDGVRHIVDRHLPLDFVATVQGDRWQGHARLANSWLPAGPHRYNATTIQWALGRRHHLSWCALAGRVPDFHQPALFQALCAG